MNGHTRKLLPAVLRSAAITCVLAPWTVPAGAQERAIIDHPMTARLDVRVPMRDGVHLSADVYRPRDDARHPTMFELTPYNNNNDGSVEQAWHFVQRGYAVVMADVRGRYDSEGEFDPYRSDGPDGSDLMNWIAGQSWSNGKVASMGGSYTGHNQWMMAKENNPHHAAIVSYVAPADEAGLDVHLDDGDVRPRQPVDPRMELAGDHVAAAARPAR